MDFIITWILIRSGALEDVEWLPSLIMRKSGPLLCVLLISVPTLLLLMGVYTGIEARGMGTLSEAQKHLLPIAGSVSLVCVLLFAIVLKYLSLILVESTGVGHGNSIGRIDVDKLTQQQ